jgi:hypothetical protein
MTKTRKKNKELGKEVIMNIYDTEEKFRHVNTLHL